MNRTFILEINNFIEKKNKKTYIALPQLPEPIIAIFLSDGDDDIV
jgi:hypothetical protein